MFHWPLEINGMDPTSSFDFLGPPRKKMRKGTKSCVECMYVDP